MPRRPTPTELKVLRGTRSSRINHAAPRPITEDPIPPEWLSGEGRAYWDRLLPELLAMGHVRRVDSTAIGFYVDALARADQARVLLRDHPVVKDEHGGARRSPASFLLKDATNDAYRWARELGLTPSARATLTTQTARDHDGLDPARWLT